MSRKTVSFGQVISYINKPLQKGRIAVMHNLVSCKDTVKAVARDFLDNYGFSRKRKNGVVLYHEILSFCGDDKERLRPEIMNNLARKYLEIRAPEALGYAKAHYDTDNPHVHVIVSGNLIKSPRKLRMTRARFIKIKREMEEYQRREYPELVHSLVFEAEKGKKGGGRNRDNEKERGLDGGKESLPANPETISKEDVAKAVFESLVESFSQDEFVSNLKEKGFEFYCRGKTAGVKDMETGKKYRLKKLGLDGLYSELEVRWQKRSGRAKGIDKIMLERFHEKWLSLGFKDIVSDVLGNRFSRDLTLKAIEGES